MTSLEHESADTSVSASDYGADNWDQENWGDMDVSCFHSNDTRCLYCRLFQTSQDPSSPLAGPPPALSANLTLNVSSVMSTAVVNDGRDGWDNDEWGNLEEEPANEELEERANHDSNHLSASRSNSNSQAHSQSSSGGHNNNVNGGSPVQNNGSGETLLNSSSNSNSNWDNYGTAWNDDEFEPIDDGNSGIRALDTVDRRF